jgi:hypothetical protein
MLFFVYQTKKDHKMDGMIRFQSGTVGVVSRASVIFFGGKGTTAAIGVFSPAGFRNGRHLNIMVEQRVEVGYTFPVQDKVYRVVGMSKPGSSEQMYVDPQPVEVPGLKMSLGSLCTPFVSRCELEAEKLRFDIEGIKPDDKDPKHVGGCWVLIHPANAPRRWLGEPAPTDCRREFAQPGRQVLLDSNFALELIQVVPHNEQRKTGGWAEFRLQSGNDVIKFEPHAPTT